MSRIRHVVPTTFSDGVGDRPARKKAVEPPAPAARKRVIFLCIGNLCRSPMAEAFARAYGSDCLEAVSVGLAPASGLPSLTGSVLREKNIDLGEHVPKPLRDLDLRCFDLLVNISGRPMPFLVSIPVETWLVEDPYGGTQEDYRKARDQIEMLVMRLILKIRTGKFDSTVFGSPQ